jgi:hypothetical protein
MSQQRGLSKRAPQTATPLDYEPRKFFFGYWRSVSIAVWADQADGKAAQRARRLSEHMAQSCPQGHSNVGFVLGGVPPPTEEARAAFSHLFDGRATDLHCMGMVLEGEGFWASGLRSTITHFNMLSPNRLALRLYSTIDEVARWLPGEHYLRTGDALDVDQLREVLTTTRYQLVKELADIG